MTDANPFTFQTQALPIAALRQDHEESVIGATGEPFQLS
jgi:hypothetical protein